MAKGLQSLIIHKLYCLKIPVKPDSFDFVENSNHSFILIFNYLKSPYVRIIYGNSFNNWIIYSFPNNPVEAIKYTQSLLQDILSANLYGDLPYF